MPHTNIAGIKLCKYLSHLISMSLLTTGQCYIEQMLNTHLTNAVCHTQQELNITVSKCLTSKLSNNTNETLISGCSKLKPSHFYGVFTFLAIPQRCNSNTVYIYVSIFSSLNTPTTYASATHIEGRDLCYQWLVT